MTLRVTESCKFYVHIRKQCFLYIWPTSSACSNKLISMRFKDFCCPHLCKVMHRKCTVIIHDHKIIIFSKLFQIGQGLSWGSILRKLVKCLSAQRSSFTTAASTNCEYFSLNPFILFSFTKYRPAGQNRSISALGISYNLSSTLADISLLKIYNVNTNAVWSLPAPCAL